MTARAYYNEIEPFAADWLESLIGRGLIAPGEVDRRSIEDVQPDDLDGFTQCHFFAGIGGWSLALRMAGWQDDWPVWTASLPCQPFSAAGLQKGADDDRHLWPVFHALLTQRAPAVCFGEQVASRAGLEWWDGVSDDLETAAYTSAAVDLCAAGAGAPHIRQRLYWVAYSMPTGRAEGGSRPGLRPSAGVRGNGAGVANASGAASGRDATAVFGALQEITRGPHQGVSVGSENGSDHSSGLGDTSQPGSQGFAGHGSDGDGSERQRAQQAGPAAAAGVHGPGLADAKHMRQRGGGARGQAPAWLWRCGSADGCVICQQPDGAAIARRAEPGTFPLAYGVPKGMGRSSAAEQRVGRIARAAARNRVGRLRGYGNAIVPQLAAEFVSACMEVLP